MSVSNITVKSKFLGDGVTLLFPIQFAYIPLDTQMIKVRVFNELGVEVLPAPAWVLSPDIDNPTHILFDEEPPTGYEILVYRSIPYTQVIEFMHGAPIRPKNIEEGLDRLAMMVQQLLETFGRVPQLDIYFDGINPVIESFNPNDILAINETGDGFIAIDPATLVGEAVGGMVQSVDGETGEIEFTGSYYSTRFNETFTFTSLRDFIEKVIQPGYAPPSVSLTSNVGVGPYEIGFPITAINFSAVVGVESNPITQVEFAQAGTPFDTQTSGGAIPDGGTSTAAWTGSIANTTTFSVAVTDDSGNPATTASRTFNYVRPYFWGTGATDSLTAANVAALTKDIRVSSASVARNYTVAGGNYFYFAQPASYPVIAKIYDINGFEVQGNFTSFTGNYTALDGSSQSFRSQSSRCYPHHP